MLQGREAVARFLGVDDLVVERLYRMGLLSIPMEWQLRHNIDQVLRCETFLSEELVGPAGLARWVGLPLAWEHLRTCGPLQSRNPLSTLDRRIAVEGLVALAKRIRLAVSRVPTPRQPVALSEALRTSDRLFKRAADLVAKLLTGGVGSADWRAPYRWADLFLDARELSSAYDQWNAQQTTCDVLQ